MGKLIPRAGNVHDYRSRSTLPQAAGTEHAGRGDALSSLYHLKISLALRAFVLRWDVQ